MSLTPVCHPHPKHTTYTAPAVPSHQTQTSLNSPVPRAPHHQSALPKGTELTRQSTGRGNRRGTGPGRAWPQALGLQAGVTQRPAPLQVPSKKTSSPRVPSKPTKGPSTAGLPTHWWKGGLETRVPCKWRWQVPCHRNFVTGNLRQARPSWCTEISLKSIIFSLFSHWPALKGQPAESSLLPPREDIFGFL